jgi:hypothetical protein
MGRSQDPERRQNFDRASTLSHLVPATGELISELASRSPGDHRSHQGRNYHCPKEGHGLVETGAYGNEEGENLVDPRKGRGSRLQGNSPVKLQKDDAQKGRKGLNPRPHNRSLGPEIGAP